VAGPAMAIFEAPKHPQMHAVRDGFSAHVTGGDDVRSERRNTDADAGNRARLLQAGAVPIRASDPRDRS
jgi:hypothetical protein